MTSPVDTSVKIFHSGMAGAPTVDGATLGSLVTLLDACLRDGWGSRTITSLVVASGIATATYTGGLGPFEKDSVALVAGVTGGLTALNGEQKLLSANSTTFTFATAAADGTAAGTITAKIAPAGFTTPFTATNKRVYKSADVASSSFYFRVDDGIASQPYAFVRAYETMSDIDTGTAPFPTALQFPDGGYWHRGASFSSSVAIPWYVIADGRMFYFCRAVSYPSSTNQLNMMVNGFGDFVSSKAGDVHNCVANMASSGTTNHAGGQLTCCERSFTSNSGTFTARDASALLGSTIVARYYSSVPNDLYSGGSGHYGEFPNRTNNGLILLPLEIYAGANAVAAVHQRGVMPGLYHSAQYLKGAYQSGARISGGGPFSGKVLMAIKGDNPDQSGLDPLYGGAIFFDITGPWR